MPISVNTNKIGSSRSKHLLVLIKHNYYRKWTTLSQNSNLSSLQFKQQISQGLKKTSINLQTTSELVKLLTSLCLSVANLEFQYLHGIKIQYRIASQNLVQIKERRVRIPNKRMKCQVKEQLKIGLKQKSNYKKPYGITLARSTVKYDVLSQKIKTNKSKPRCMKALKCQINCQWLRITKWLRLCRMHCLLLSKMLRKDNLHCRKINLKTNSILNDCSNKRMVTSQYFKLHCSVIILNSINLVNNCLYLWLVFIQHHLNGTQNNTSIRIYVIEKKKKKEQGVKTSMQLCRT